MNAIQNINAIGNVVLLENASYLTNARKVLYEVSTIVNLYFPELKNTTIYIGVMNYLDCKKNILASVDIENNVLRFSTSHFPKMYLFFTN